jgi:hypothetical protein
MNTKDVSTSMAFFTGFGGFCSIELQGADRMMVPSRSVHYELVRPFLARCRNMEPRMKTVTLQVAPLAEFKRRARDAFQGPQARSAYQFRLA